MKIKDIIPEYKPLTQKEFSEVMEVQENLRKVFNSTPKEGREVEYLGKNFIVYPSVFHPRPDSVALVKNFNINQGDEVLDLATGCGTIAIFAAEKGASKIVATDVNPNSIKAARENAGKFKYSNIIEVRKSDCFENIKDDEKFDVITANLPFTKAPAGDSAMKAMRDPDFKLNKKFFKKLRKHLKENGGVYMSQANFGSLDDFFELARQNGFSVELIGENDIENSPIIFYAFKLTPVNK